MIKERIKLKTGKYSMKTGKMILKCVQKDEKTAIDFTPI